MYRISFVVAASFSNAEEVNEPEDLALDDESIDLEK